MKSPLSLNCPAEHCNAQMDSAVKTKVLFYLPRLTKVVSKQLWMR